MHCVLSVEEQPLAHTFPYRRQLLFLHELEARLRSAHLDFRKIVVKSIEKK
jgi:hypothetical protein